MPQSMYLSGAEEPVETISMREAEERAQDFAKRMVSGQNRVNAALRDKYGFSDKPVVDAAKHHSWFVQVFFRMLDRKYAIVPD